MFVVKPRPTVFCDVDDTLVMWNKVNDKPRHLNPLTTVKIECDGKESESVVNTHVVKQIKELSRKGHNVIVWSGGHVTWAEAVVRALGLEEYVTCVIPKPYIYIDDIKDPSKWMGKHQYINVDGTIGEFNG